MKTLLVMALTTTAAAAGFALYIKDEQIKAKDQAIEDLTKLTRILIKHMDDGNPDLDRELAEFQSFIEIRNNINLTADEGV